MFNRRAEKIIRMQIDQMTIHRLIFKRNEIERTIEWMYMAGTFSRRKADKMIELLMHKYEEIEKEDLRKLNETMDREYQSFRNKYGL